MRSMTGFGRGSAGDDQFSVTVEMKSVNNRFLDINLRLHSEMSAFEPSIKRAITDRLDRGRVDVSIQTEKNAEAVYEVNKQLAAGYLAAMKELQTELDLDGTADINVIAKLPNVIVPKKEEFDGEWEKTVREAVDEAVSNILQMRETEGNMLAAELESRLSTIEEKLKPIEAEAATVTTEIGAKLSKRIEDLLGKISSEVDIDPGRLAQEIAYLADRADISEEIARLNTHIEHFRGIMNEQKEVGKRLDFLTQELNREANTIASKTNNMVIKENALSIKSEIEKIREQVQNVE